MDLDLDTSHQSAVFFETFSTELPFLHRIGLPL